MLRASQSWEFKMPIVFDIDSSRYWNSNFSTTLGLNLPIKVLNENYLYFKGCSSWKVYFALTINVFISQKRQRVQSVLFFCRFWNQYFLTLQTWSFPTMPNSTTSFLIKRFSQAFVVCSVNALYVSMLLWLNMLQFDCASCHLNQPSNFKAIFLHSNKSQLKI